MTVKVFLFFTCLSLVFGENVAFPRTSQQVDDYFATAGIKFLNYFRERHNALPLTLDKELQISAAACAEFYAMKAAESHLVGVEIEKLSPNSFQKPCIQTNGGNEVIFLTDPGLGVISYARAFSEWEKEGYDFEFPDQETIEDFQKQTQMLWKGSKDVGCACDKTEIKIIGDEDSFIKNICSCIFYPPGNVQTGFGDNMLQKYEENLQDVNTTASVSAS